MAGSSYIHNAKQRYAIQKKNEERILKVNNTVNKDSGIYFLTRVDENGFKFAYVGQAVHLLERLASHLSGYMWIDLSLKKHGLYDKGNNPYGWNISFMNCSKAELDEQEQFWIKRYADAGYQLRNKTSGSQGAGKSQIDEYRPAKGYRDGLEQGYKNASKEISHLFDLHLDVTTKSTAPNANQRKALEKFKDFLNYHKGEKENGKGEFRN